MDYTIIFGISATILSLVAIGISIWQGFLSKQQLEQAKDTKRETEKLLEDIKLKMVKIETISDETRKDVKEQISKMIDKNDENFKEVLKNSGINQFMEIAKLGNFNN